MHGAIAEVSKWNLMLSKAVSECKAGISHEVGLELSWRQPVYKWHDYLTGVSGEHENLSL